MSRAPFPPLSFQQEEFLLNFSFQVLVTTGVISLIRGGGGRILSIGTMASGVSVVTLNTPYPPQMLWAVGSANLVAAGIDGGSVEVDTESYSATAGTFNIRHCVAAGTVGNPVGTTRINCSIGFIGKKALRYT